MSLLCRFVALNDVTDNESVIEIESRKPETAEAQESTLVSRYNEGVQLLATGDEDSGIAILESLLQSPAFARSETAPTLKPGDSKSVVLINLRNALWTVLGRHSALRGQYGKSLELYLKVARVSNDPFLWCKVGTLAFKSNRFFLSRAAFEQGLKIDRLHWPCLDKLISLLFICGDFHGCLHYVSIAVQVDCEYRKGLALIRYCFDADPTLEAIWLPSFKSLTRRITTFGNDDEVMAPLLNLRQNKCSLRTMPIFPVLSAPALYQFSWEAVGNVLLKCYLLHIDSKQSLSSTCSLSSWLPVVSFDVEVASTLPAAGIEQLPVSQNNTQGQDSYINPAGRVLQQIHKSLPPMDSGPSSVETSGSEREDTTGLNVGVVLKKTQKKLVSSGTTDEDTIYKRRSTRFIPGYTPEDTEDVNAPDAVVKRVAELLPKIFQQFDGLSRRDASSASLHVREAEGLPVMQSSQSEVCEFLKRNETGCTIVEIYGNYLTELVMRNDILWRKELCTYFVAIYARWAQHAAVFWQPRPSEAVDTHGAMETEFARVLCKIHMTFVEICAGHFCGADGGNDVEKSTVVAKVVQLATIDEADLLRQWIAALAYLRQAARWESVFDTLFCHDLTARAYWIYAWFLLNKNDLDQVEDIVTNVVKTALSKLGVTGLVFRNASVDITAINADTVSDLLERVRQRRILTTVQEIYKKGDFSAVVEVLGQQLSNEVTGGPHTSIQTRLKDFMLLISALFQLGRSDDALPWLVKVVDETTRCLRHSVSTANSDLKVLGDHLSDALEALCDIAAVSVGRFCQRLENENVLQVLVQALLNLIRLMTSLSTSNIIFNAHLPWLLLYRISAYYEMQHFDEAYRDEWYSRIAPNKILMANRSCTILLMAHEQLGRLKLCTAFGGKLLLAFADEILQLLRDPALFSLVPQLCIDDMLNATEQCIYCLYRYPNRRVRHLEDHKGAQPIALRWEDVHTLFEFVKPEVLPEFNDRQDGSNRLSSEAAALLRQIELVIPVSCSPEPYVCVVRDYLDGAWPTLPRINVRQNQVTVELFHLLADYHMKSQEHNSAVHYYELDLCLNPDRFDTYAGLALVKGRLLLDQMNVVDLKYDWHTFRPFGKQSRVVMRCYERALELDAGNTVLWTEYGLFVYQLQSYFSRLLKKSSCLSDDIIQRVQEQKAQLLLTAKHAYTTVMKAAAAVRRDAASGISSPRKQGRSRRAANQSNNSGGEEEWLHYYMLGKIAEKMRGSIFEVLQHYFHALCFLHMDAAQYPEKIRYQNPQRYALETLEVFYRAHVAVVKALDTQTLDTEQLRALLRRVLMLKTCPLAERERIAADKVAAALWWTSDPDVAVLVNDLVDAIANGIAMENFEDIREDIVKHCVESLALCSRRFSGHYKALYWLAKLYSENPMLKDLKQSTAALLGPSCDFPVKIGQSLFQERKQSNLFNALWRIPSDDIDRYGSFGNHMSRCVDLLLQVLHDSLNHRELIHLAVQLSRKPDTEKQYLSESDRISLFGDAVESTRRVLLTHLSKAFRSENRTKMKDVCLAIFDAWTSLNKAFSETQSRDWKQLVKGAHKKTANVQTPSKSPLGDALNYFRALAGTRDQSTKAVKQPNLARKRQLPHVAQHELPVGPATSVRAPPSAVPVSDASKPESSTVGLITVSDMKPSKQAIIKLDHAESRLADYTTTIMTGRTEESPDYKIRKTDTTRPAQFQSNNCSTTVPKSPSYQVDGNKTPVLAVTSATRLPQNVLRWIDVGDTEQGAQPNPDNTHES